MLKSKDKCMTAFPNDLMLKSNFTKDTCNTAWPCAVCGTPTQCTDTKLGTKYIGNNGSASGDTYCKGGWGNTNNADKNMKCVGQYAVDTGETLECGKAYGKPTDVYCGAVATKYIGNNGSASGDTYCKGGWGNTNNADKNMKCIGQYDLDTNANVPCDQAYGKPTNVYCA
jgi:hypothetical protein